MNNSGLRTRNGGRRAGTSADFRVVALLVRGRLIVFGRLNGRGLGDVLPFGGHDGWSYGRCVVE